MRTSELETLRALPTPPQEQIGKLVNEIERYQHEKKQIQSEAAGLAAQSKAAEHKEHLYEYSAVGIELGIVIAGVALLMHKRVVFYLSILAALAGVAGTVYTGLLLKDHGGEAHGAGAQGAPAPSGQGH